MMKTTGIQTSLFDTIDHHQRAATILDDEIWKSLPEFPDYEFSNLGRTRSYRSGRERYFFGGKMPSGHRSIELQPGRHQEYLSKVIARLFLGPYPSDNHVVRHLNSDPDHNRVVNLAYGTPQQNSIERHQHAGTYTGKRSRAHKGVARKHKLRNSPYNLLTTAIRDSEDGNAITIPMSLAREIAAMLKK